MFPCPSGSSTAFTCALQICWLAAREPALDLKTRQQPVVRNSPGVSQCFPLGQRFYDHRSHRKENLFIYLSKLY